MMIKIATLLNSVEPIVLSKKDKNGVFTVVLRGTPLARYACEIYPRSSVIAVDWQKSDLPDIDGIGFEEAIKYTDLTKKLQALKITHFVVPHESTAVMDAWSKKTGIKLILVEGKMQRRLENKILFDQLLKANHVPSPRTYSVKDLKTKSLARTSLVVQEAVSHGMYGTKFYHGGAEAFAAIGRKDEKKLLIRAYENGVPVGVSMFLDGDDNLFFSGLRRQCFVYKNGFPSQYIGIQWLPYNFFKPQQLRAVENVLKKLAVVYKNLGFVGVANFDLLVKTNGVSVIECNPRLSAATPQVFSVPGLVKPKSSWEFYCNSFTGIANRPCVSPEIPKSKFAGAELDIDIDDKSVFKAVARIGMYCLRGKKIIYVGKNYQVRTAGKYFFVTHDFNQQGKVVYPVNIGCIFSSFSLFDLKKGEINRDGSLIVEHFKKLCLK